MMRRRDAVAVMEMMLIGWAVVSAIFVLGFCRAAAAGDRLGVPEA